MSADEEARRIRERLSDKEAARLINAPRRSVVEIAKGTGATYLSPAPAKAHTHDVHRITHPVTGDLYEVCPCGWEINLSEANPDDDGDRPTEEEMKNRIGGVWAGDDERRDERSTDFNCYGIHNFVANDEDDDPITGLATCTECGEERIDLNREGDPNFNGAFG